MWDEIKKMPPIVVGQSILNFLDIKSIVHLETALTKCNHIQILGSFLSYLSKGSIEVIIPKEMCKLKWLQAHDFPISKAIVHLDKIKTTFDTKMIDQIMLIEYGTITNTSFDYLHDSCYEKVTSVWFGKEQNENLIEKLFSRLYNLRELNVSGRPEGWIQNAINSLYIGTNNNILLEKITMFMSSTNTNEGSIVEIVKYCSKLKSLTVWFDITEESLLALSTYCPLLQELYIPNLPKILIKENIRLYTHALACIHTIWTPNIVNNTVTTNYTYTIPYLTNLRKLIANSYVDHIFIPLFTQYCQKLEYMHINNDSCTTTLQLQQLIQNCHNLHTLEISIDTLCTDEIILTITQYCKNIKKLLLCCYTDANITNTSILALSKHCTQLEELELNCMPIITDTVLIRLIQECKQLYKLILPDMYLSEDSEFGVPVTVEIDETDSVTYTFDRK